MPKKHRLSHADFETLVPEKREHGAFFTLTTSKNPDNKPRFACIVSKKVSLKAVDRNLVRRRVKAALQEQGAQKLIGIYVFSAKKQANGASYSEISTDVKRLLAKVAC